MNAQREERRIVLRISLGDLTWEDIQSEDFQTKLIRGKCDGCGSNSHSLIKETSRVGTRSGVMTYEYGCPIVTPNGLYNVQSSGRTGAIINITYYLTSDKYAESCNYDEATVMERLPPICISKTGLILPIADAFVNEVKRLCWENEYHNKGEVDQDSHC